MPGHRRRHRIHANLHAASARRHEGGTSARQAERRMKESFDLLIVGAGPAGMHAAIEARSHGLNVVVADDQPAPGGQIWRAVERRSSDTVGKILGEDYQT